MNRSCFKIKSILALGYVMENRIINKCGFSYLVVIWYEVMNHEEYLEGSGQMMFRSLFVWIRKTMTGK